MFYSAQLDFLKLIIKKLNINITVLSSGNFQPENDIDYGLRKLLGLNNRYDEMFNIKYIDLNQNTVYKIADEFFCEYVYINLPDTDEKSILIIGPFAKEAITEEKISEKAKKYRLSDNIVLQIQKFYTGIPYLDGDENLTAIINSFAEIIWMGEKILKLNTKK